MRASFFHDSKIYHGEDGKFYSLILDYNIWNRYLDIFDELLVCTRKACDYSEIYKDYKISNTENVYFKLNINYKSPIDFFVNNKKSNKIIEEVVKASHCCIVRLPSFIGIMAIKECIKQNKPYIVEVVGCAYDSLWNYGNIKGKLLAPIAYLLNRKYIKNSNYVTYVSEKFLQKRYPCYEKISYCSDVKIYNTDEKILKKRLNKINRKKNFILVGIIGSVDVEYKGHKIAINAISILKKKGYNVILKCLGAGNSNRLEELAIKLNVINNIEFCGVLPSGNDVFKWLDSIDIFIMPSMTEGMPRALIEAMSRGCPSIGTRTGGITELLEQEFLIEKKDYLNLSKLIENFIKDKNIMIDQAKRNFYFSKKFLDKDLSKKRKEFLQEFRNYVEKNMR